MIRAGALPPPTAAAPTVPVNYVTDRELSRLLIPAEDDTLSMAVKFAGATQMKASLIGVAMLGALVGACASVEPQQLDVATMSGVKMYETFCASCHGVSGEGDGPVAPLVKIHVPDLTRVAQRDGGEFPTEDVRRTIDGRFDRPAHGPRDMPVWGWQFYGSTTLNDANERARVDQLIGRLVDYLRSIQKE